MHSQCDVLILSARFGHGHMAVAQAISDYVTGMDGSLKVETVDFYEVINPYFYKSMYKGFEMLIKNGHQIYNMYYYRKNESDALGAMDSVTRSNMNRLAKRLAVLKPKMVISTFPVCAAYMSEYKKRYDVSISAATCITDVVDSNEWINDSTDLYFVATDDIKDALRYKDVPYSNILVTGIPVKSGFMKLRSRTRLREEYGYDSRDRIILMMGGGLGLLPDDEQFYQRLKGSVPGAKIIVLAGNNKSLYQKLNRLKVEDMQVLKFTDRVADYMQMSDVLVGKAGGITLFESIACRIPLVVYKPVLGQEIGNCNYIEDKHIGFVTYSEETLLIRLRSILDNRETKQFMKHRINQLRDCMNMEVLSRRIVEICRGEDEPENWLGVI